MRAALGVVLSLLLPASAAAHDFEARESGSTEVTRSFARVLEIESFQSRAYAELYSYIADDQLWSDTHVNLAVCFWDLDRPEWTGKVVEIADKVTVGLPVTFIWKQGGQIQACTQANRTQFDVRVSLKPNAARLASIDNPETFFAVIGRNGRTDSRLATVNLPFRLGDPQAKFENRVTHEFCHVLGCLHEHQRGDCANAFDEAKIRNKYGLSAEAYRQQYLQVDERMSATARGPFDRTSAMMYDFSPDLFITPTPPTNCLRPSEPTALSSLDTSGLKAAYTNRANRLTLAAFLARPDDLAANARTQRAQAVLFRAERPRMRGLNVLNPFAYLERSDLNRRALGAEAQATALDAEAATFRLKPETVEALKAAVGLAERARPSEGR